VLALKLDQVALYGTGTDPEPRGLKNTSGILTASMGANGAAIANHDPLVDAVGTLRDNNEDPTAIVYSPRTGRALAKLKDTTSQPLSVSNYLDGVARAGDQPGAEHLDAGCHRLGRVHRRLAAALRRGADAATNLGAHRAVRRHRTGGSPAWYRGDVAVARPKVFHVTSGVL
jgi:hypothetical protein